MTDNGLTLSQQRKLSVLAAEMDKIITEQQKALDYMAKAMVKTQEQATRLRRILLERN